MPDCHNGQAPERPTDDQDEIDPTQAPAVSFPPVRQLFSVPTPIKRIFDRFPFVIYPPNELPTRLTPHARCNRLFVFLDIAGARQRKPSFNPQCLRWQAYLKFVGIDFELVPSTNHASPSGALPYLLPAPSVESPLPIPAHKLQKWAIEQVHCEEEQQISVRFDVYASLLDHRIRNAWLYQLYLDNDNFNAVARRLYVNFATSSTIVRAALAVQLQQAARDELRKYSDYIDVNDLEAEAGNAFEALSILLGSATYFFDRGKPGFFDASVFAYTHLILEENMMWKHNRLGQLLRRHENLVQHRERILEDYFGNR